MPGDKDSWLSRNAERLARQDWATPSALAQELYTILADTPSQGLSGTSQQVQQRRSAITTPFTGGLIASRNLPESPRIVQDQSASKDRVPVNRGDRSGTVSPPGPLEIKKRTPTKDEATPQFPGGPTDPYKMGPPFPDWEWFLPLGGGGGGTSDLIGQVVSASGSPAQVQLFPNGSQGTPGKTVDVYIIQLDDHEIIPEGTWITGIQQHTDQDQNSRYEAQLPIWLS